MADAQSGGGRVSARSCAESIDARCTTSAGFQLVSTERPDDRQELDDIDPPSSPFISGDETRGQHGRIRVIPRGQVESILTYQGEGGIRLFPARPPNLISNSDLPGGPVDLPTPERGIALTPGTSVKVNIDEVNYHSVRINYDHI